ncbi:hypothetical protein [Lactobacillus corticis]|uniref:Uncharacterized protein n=1 Tax=Lactobacillus corticis TaxID=2201249 RepID=A0A916QGL0_9LACO|nr:hypothetical protein [Lactobacillus corticis]GFZ26604.1 hypothetical protein LCB40_04840 [Lactobacillus corticis]
MTSFKALYRACLLGRVRSTYVAFITELALSVISGFAINQWKVNLDVFACILGMLAIFTFFTVFIFYFYLIVRDIRDFGRPTNRLIPISDTKMYLAHLFSSWTQCLYLLLMSLGAGLLLLLPVLGNGDVAEIFRDNITITTSWHLSQADLINLLLYILIVIFYAFVIALASYALLVLPSLLVPALRDLLPFRKGSFWGQAISIIAWILTYVLFNRFFVVAFKLFNLDPAKLSVAPDYHLFLMPTVYLLLGILLVIGGIASLRYLNEPRID